MKNNDTRRQFGVTLQRIMDTHHMERIEFANRLGVSYSTVCSWLSGRKFPHINKVDAISEMFGIPKSVLMEPYHEKDNTADNWLKALFADDPATLAAINKMSKMPLNIYDPEDSATISENTKIMLRTVLRQVAGEVDSSTP